MSCSIEKTGCRCNCGYRCGGPGRCDYKEKYAHLGIMERTRKCIDDHYVRDCDHSWDGPVVEFSNGASVSCSGCGMLAIDHDCAVGP